MPSPITPSARTRGLRGALFGALLALTSFAPAAVAQQAPPADPFAYDHRANQQRIESNSFITDRRLTNQRGQDYAEWLGARFLRDVSTWHEGMTVVDAGAGSAGMFGELIANEQSGQRPGFQPRTLPKMVAVSVRRPGRVSGGDRVQYVEGWLGKDDFGVERQIGEGKVDRIVEVFGATHYAEDIGKVLQGYGRMLRTGGQVAMVFDHSRTSFENEQGEPMAPEAYFKQLPGFRAVAFEDNNRFIAGQMAVTLERTEGSVEGLETETRSFSSGNSATPRRRYRVVPRRVPTVTRAIRGAHAPRAIGGSRLPPRGGVGDPGPRLR